MSIIVATMKASPLTTVEVLRNSGGSARSASVRNSGRILRGHHGRLQAILLIIVALFLAESTAIAHERKCTANEATEADAIADQLDTWAKLESAVQKYGHCDSGSIAEGYSEAVARLLVDHWSDLPTLVRLAGTDPRLRTFVLRHVDSTLDTADLAHIARLSTTSCPNGATGLCRDLRKVATSSLHSQSR